MNIHSAVVAGSGQMGPGIAYTLASVGCQVQIFARTTDSVERGLAGSNDLLDTLRSEGLLKAG